MPGNYTITLRSDGETISGAKYNGDHQNHIDNLEPTKIDDYSVSVSQMRSSVDPGEVDSESLASSLSGELERVRFAVKELKQNIDPGLTQWYQTPTRPMVQCSYAAQTVNNASSEFVVFDTPTIDTDSFYSAGSPGVVTIPYTGRYAVTASTSWASNNVGIRIALITTSLVGQIAQTAIQAAAESTQTMAHAEMAFTAGETLRVQIFQSSGAPLAISGYYLNMLTVVWVGP